MATVEQIKAARALLGWSQAQLAQVAGYALPTINNLERGETTPRPATMQDVQQTLEKAGVQFLDSTGVRLVKETLDVHMLDGENCLRHLHNDILMTLDHGGDLCVSGVEEEKFLIADRVSLYNYLKLTFERDDIRTRVLYQEGDVRLLQPADFDGIDPVNPLRHMVLKRTEWRWVPPALFSTVPMYIYGDKCGIILWGPPLRVVILHNPSIAATFRQQFEAMWALARDIPDSLKPFG